MFNPTNAAAAAKTAARAELRAKAILSLTAQQYRLKQQLAEIQKTAEETTRRIIRLNWESAQAAENGNPDAGNIKERNGKSVEALTKETEGYATRVAELKKEITGLQEKIEKIESGEKKMSYDSILNLADDFLHQATLEAFTSGEFDKEAA